MSSETRYALNGDLRLAPELPSLQGWVEAMTSLGRLIFFDQPGTGASDPGCWRSVQPSPVQKVLSRWWYRLCEGRFSFRDRGQCEPSGFTLQRSLFHTV